MSRKFEELYKVQNTSEISQKLWNRVFSDLDGRTAELEAIKPEVEAALTDLSQVGLDRINQILAPAVEKIGKLTELGFLVAHSTTPLTLEVNENYTWVIPPGDERDLFHPSPLIFVAITGESGTENYAVVETIDYNRQYGEFLGRVKQKIGLAGANAAWEMSAVAGSLMAQVAILDMAEIVQADIASMVALYEGYKNTTVAAKDTAVAAAATATTKAGEASSSASSANNSANTATTAKNTTLEARDEILGILEGGAGSVKATQAEAEAGVNDNKFMTPLQTKNAIYVFAEQALGDAHPWQITYIADGTSETLILPEPVTLDDLLVFENGIEQQQVGMTLDTSTQLTLDARAVGNKVRVVRMGGPRGQGIMADAVGNLAGRDTYDAEASGFVYLLNDNINGVYYVKGSGAGVWDGPFYIRGATGPAGANALDPWTRKTAGFAVTDKGRYKVVLTADAVIDLPTGAIADGFEFWIQGHFGTYKATLTRHNGENIQGVAEDYTLDLDNTGRKVTYFAADGWMVTT